MKRMLAILLLSVCTIGSASAGGPEDSLLVLKEQIKLMDSIQSSLKWQTGQVTIGTGIIKLNVPAGFKFLDVEQSKYILHDIWGNPPRDDIWGMIFPENGGPWADSSFAFVLSFEETGYIKDKDADEMDYAAMLKDYQESEKEVNTERLKQGYESIHFVSWAQSPFYDKNKKVLHWAKEIRFGQDPLHTLNYEVRVLGRRGVLSMNAIATMDELGLVKQNIDKVLSIPEFTEGNKYSDFNSNTDKVAEYGIGALVAGGVLAKTGALGAIGKFFVAAWKFIAIGVVALIAAGKKFFGKKKTDEPIEA
jgi:uncharacterized membrane-anchored protein